MASRFHITACLAATAALLASNANARQVVIDFDSMQGFTGSFSQGTPVPSQFIVNTQFIAQGVIFNSNGGGVVVCASGNPVSAPNVADATGAGPVLSYTDPVTATFVCNTAAAVVDTVSISLSNSSSTSTLEAYGLAGTLLGSTVGGGSQTLTVTFPGQIHSVVILQGPMAFDDFTFSPTPVCGPLTFCTAGTTSHGCLPSISATGTASASSSSGFTIRVSPVEGLKAGLIFYGIDNSGFSAVPWGAGSSFLCIKHPTQRTGVQSSGGTFNACDGQLTLDWNAYRATHVTALGNPFAAGHHVLAQGWFRDPPSPKATMLSNALDFVVGP